MQWRVSGEECLTKRSSEDTGSYTVVVAPSLASSDAALHPTKETSTQAYDDQHNAKQMPAVPNLQFFFFMSGFRHAEAFRFHFAIWYPKADCSSASGPLCAARQ